MKPYLFAREEVVTMPYFFSQPKVGDVIVFRHIVPPFVFCKRIKKIINNEIWVEGENKKVSIDSRKFGFVERKNIIGKVILKL
jgi:type IV secretory pathway protease TraF